MSTVDLVGPKGYVHGWRYVGGPGLPSVEPGRGKTGVDLGGHAPESAEGRRRALAAGHALPPAHPGGKPGYPVTDARHWEMARDAVGRSGGGARRKALAKLLAKTAPEFGKSIKGTWIQQELSGASLSNVLNFVGPEGYVHGWIRVGPGSSDVGHHGKTVIGLTGSGNKVRGRYDAVHKQVMVGTSGAVQVTHIQPAGQDHSNRRAGVEYDLSARYRALNFADDGDNDMDDMPGRGKLQCPNCGYRSDNSDFQITGGSSGTSDPAGPSALQTPAPNDNQGKAGFAPGSSGLQVRSKGGSYMANGAGRGIELARRQVTSASDIVVSRGADGSAVIRHRRGGETIGTIQRLADGKWGGAIEGGRELDPRQHQRAALQDLIGNWNRAQVSPFRPAMPLQQAPAQTPLMNQFGVTNVRALATPVNGASDGARTTSSDSGSDGGSGPAGLGPKGVSIYKKLIAKGFPAARALSFARRAESFGQKAS